MVFFSKYEKYLLGYYLKQLVFTFFIAQIILVLQFFWVFVDEILGKGIALKYILELLFWASIGIIPMSISIAILLSSLMIIGNISENSEMVAIRSSGISLFRLSRLLIVSNIILSISIFLFNNYTVSASQIKFIKRLSDIRKKKPDFMLQPGIFNDALGDFVIRTQKKETKNSYSNVLLYNHSDNQGNGNVIYAEKATLKFSSDGNYLIFSLLNGTEYNEMESSNYINNKFQHIETKFNEKKLYIDFSSFKLGGVSEDRFRDHYKSLTMFKLDLYSDSLEKLFYPQKIKISTNLKKHIFKDSITHNNKNYTNTFNRYITDTSKKKYLYLKESLSVLGRTKDIILRYKNNIQQNNKTIAKLDIEWHHKISAAVICFAFFIIGTALGAIVKKGGTGVPFMLALICFICYYVYFIGFKKMARELSISPFLGIWYPVLSFIFVGLVLFVLVNFNLHNELIFRLKNLLKFKK